MLKSVYTLQIEGFKVLTRQKKKYQAVLSTFIYLWLHTMILLIGQSEIVGFELNFSKTKVMICDFKGF